MPTSFSDVEDNTTPRRSERSQHLRTPTDRRHDSTEEPPSSLRRSARQHNNAQSEVSASDRLSPLNTRRRRSSYSDNGSPAKRQRSQPSSQTSRIAESLPRGPSSTSYSQHTQSSSQLRSSQQTIARADASVTAHFLERAGYYIFEDRYAERFKKTFLKKWWVPIGSKQEKHVNKKKSPVCWGTDKRAWSWDFFDEGMDIHTYEPRVICRICGQALKHPGLGDGSKGLATHLESSRGCKTTGDNQGFDRGRIAAAKARADQNKDAGRSEIRTSLGSRDFPRLQNEAITAYGLPFGFFELDKIRDLFYCFQKTNDPEPLFRGATWQRGELSKTVERLGQEVVAKLDSVRRVALATDGWHSPLLNIAFLTIRAYWIDSDWTLHEELLDFPAISGRHTGRNLATYFDTVIQKFDLGSRLISMTTDNASNNGTLHTAICEAIAEYQDGIKLRAAAPNIVVSNSEDAETETVFAPDDDTSSVPEHFPCFAHIVQLAVKKFFTQLSLSPTNDRVEHDDGTIEVQYKSISNGAELHGIPLLLWKVRKLAVYVNHSAQRFEDFKRVQEELIRNPLSSPKRSARWAEIQETRPIRLIQDVKTRWSSTTIMLLRFSRLHDAIDQYVADNNLTHFVLSNKEWTQLEYLIQLTEPFLVATTAVGTTKRCSIHLILSYYNELFDMLEHASALLEKKKVTWKQTMLKALNEAWDKLRKYYSKTVEKFGDLYGFAVLLYPAMKNEFWKGDSFSSGSDKYMYWAKLRKEWETNYRHLSGATSSTTQGPQVPFRSKFAGKAGSSRAARRESHIDEFERYKNAEFEYFLDRDTEPDVLKQWEEIEKEYPTIAKMARDILCIPGAGTGCERDFSVARHQSPWNRGGYSAETFTLLMLARCRLRDLEYFRMQAQERLGQPDLSIDPMREAEDIDIDVEKSVTCGISDDEEGDPQRLMIGTRRVPRERRVRRNGQIIEEGTPAGRS